MTGAENRPKPWLAGLLSFMTVGLGQAYNREYSKGLALFISGIGITILLWTEKVTGLMGNILIIGILIYSIYDAYSTAKSINNPPNKWVLGIGILLFVMAVILSIGAFMSSWLSAVNA